jgi:hypothetical protein
MRRRLNYANVTATLALFFAMSGGALAAKHYLINSTKQINPKVLKALKGNEGPRGFSGPAGATGKEGPAGQTGANGATKVVTRFTEKNFEPNEDVYETATCEANEKITGGGFGITGNAYKNSTIIRSGLSYGDEQGKPPKGTWLAGIHSTEKGTLRVWAICASP